MLSITRNRVKLLISLLVLGLMVHVLLNQITSLYENFNIIGSYVERDDPLKYVLMNTATFSSTDNSTTRFGLNNQLVPKMRIWNDVDILSSAPGVDEAPSDWTNDSYILLQQSPDLNFCPLTPPNLVGPIRIWMDSPSMDSIEKLYPYLEVGGHGKPANCRSRHRVAVVVPYRDRDVHLRVMLHNLHPLLTKQQLDYSIIIIEQIANQTFNRAKLMNIGFVEGLKLYPWECFIFHDVDLLPEDDRNLYTCPTQPRHMSVAIDKFGYKLPYGSIFGGISAMTTGQLRAINGFSNDYWGWGGEDDDLSERVRFAGFKIERYPGKIARYKMIKHQSESSNPINKCRYKLMAKTKSRWRMDGISSLRYKIMKLELLPLFTHVVVDLLENEARRDLKKVVRC